MSTLDETLSRHFEDCGNFEAEDFLHAYGDPRQTLLAFRVFWPEFARVQGYVVLKTNVDSEETLKGCSDGLIQPLIPIQQFLAGYRWIEIGYMFAKYPFDDSDERFLADLMAETWLGALHQFETAVSWQTRVFSPEETGGGWGVGFEEEESSLS